MTSSSDKLREGIAPLLGPNYRLWAERVKTVLRSHGYWSAVAPGTPPGEGAAAQEPKDWTTADAKAYGCIFLTTSDEIQTDLARLGTENAKVLWDYLRDEYRSTSVEARLQLKSELLDALTAPKDSMRDHIGQLAGLYQQLLQIGKPVDEEEHCIELLWSLPSAYRGFKWSASATTSWTELRSKILEAERSLKREDEKDAKTRQDAAFAVYHAPSPAKSSGKGGSPASRHGSTSKDEGSFGGACWLCKQKGHRFYNCPHIDSAQDFISTKVDSKKHQDTAAMARETKKQATDSPADVDFACAVGAPSTMAGHFILDTGSSRHIVADASGLTKYRAAKPDTGIECANGGLMPVAGYGDLVVTTQAGLRIELRDVAHCPSAIGNLIGGKRLTKSGCTIAFDNTSAVVTVGESGQVLMKATVVGENWVVPLESAKTDSAMMASDTSGDPDTMHWHRCAGHIGESTLQALAATGTVAGMSKKLGPLGFCSDCAEGKIARSKHPRIAIGEREHRPLSKIHVDPFGPVNLKDGQALGGAKYGLIITDEASHHVWVSTMQYKSEAANILKAFHAQAMTRYPEKPISRIRTENASELNSAELLEYWAKHGVKVEPSPRYAPQSNGVAERAVRTVTEMCRTMLIAANLPASFWPAAVRNAAYVKNRVPATGLKKGETPYEALHGRPPKPERFRVFGCVAWAKIPEVHRTGKFSTKAMPCIYLGPAFTNASRLWDPISKKEMIEHSVVFDEEGKAGTLLEKEQSRQYEQQVAQLRALNFTGDDAQVGRVEKEPVRMGGQLEVGEGVRAAMQAVLDEDAAPEGADRGGERGQAIVQEANVGRRSARIAGQPAVEISLPPTSRKRKEPDGAYTVGTCFVVLEPSEVPYDDPWSVAEATRHKDSQLWLEAMQKELKSHDGRGTWEIVTAPLGANLISAKWVFRVKRNGDATIQKYKARLVARGFTQVQGVDFEETFAPTSRLQILRLFCALVAVLDMELHQIDFETAYLNATLTHDIYMLPPEGVELMPHQVLKLRRALYGLKQSAHDWYAVLRDSLKTIGFEQCALDPTIYVRNGESPAMLLVYVDDILIAAPKGSGVEKAKAELLGLFKGTDLGPAHYCLGIRIERDRRQKTISLDQERYAEEVLARFGMSDCKPAKTPMMAKQTLRKAVDGEARADKAQYQALVGSMAYFAQGTRADLAYFVSVLGKFCADPSEEHWIAAKHGLRYLRGTSGARLVFGGAEDLQVRGFVDADWAADKDDRRSMSGYVFTVGGGAVAWGSRKQGAVALSTAEAEYIAAGVAGREAIMLKGALTACGQLVGTIMVHCDNQAAIQLAKNPGSHHDRSKHIDIVHHWVRDQIQLGAFAFEYIPTDLNPADAFTKSLGTIKHNQHAERIGLELRRE